MEQPFKVPTANSMIVFKKPSAPAEVEPEQLSKASTPQIAINAHPPCPYREPKWSRVPSEIGSHKFEVLKNGSIVDKIDELQLRAFWVFGRLDTCHITLAHPTISRYHAVLQYRPGQDIPNDAEDITLTANGWYIYDLGSTHGTFVNKMKIPAKTYIRLKVGFLIKLGASTRLFILQGPSESAVNDENEMTITEFKIKENKAREERQRCEQERQEVEERTKAEDSVTWGMSEDADGETDLTFNPFAATNNEELFLDDPKKTLRGYFEREGLNLEYDLQDVSSGNYVCKVVLPVEDANGRPIVAQFTHKGKKKECVVQCALEACRILDRHGLLRQATHEPMRRKIKRTDSDDDDEFLDRTGDVQRKKERLAKENQTKAYTYEELLDQSSQFDAKLAEIEELVANYHAKRNEKNSDECQGDDLDSFMANLSSQKELEKFEIRKLRVEQQRIRTEQINVAKLIKIAAPVKLPDIIQTSVDNKKQKMMPLFGKRKNLMRPMITAPKQPSVCRQSAVVVPHEKSAMCELEQDNDEEAPAVAETNTMPENEPIPGKMNIVSSSSKTTLAAEPVDGTKDKTSANMKKRRRIRIRGDKHRDNVDMADDEELEVPEKFSKWLPPNNQTGDGFTTLNKKFGY